MAWEVFTFGNGDVLTQILIAVRGVMSDANYKGLITLVVTLGLFLSFWQAFWEGNKFSIPWKTWLATIMIIGALFTPRTDVIIRDEVKNTQTLVENVPWGLGAFASFFTSVQKSIAKLFDKYFSLPDDLKFTNSGYAFGLTALDTAPESVIMDPYLMATVSSFIAKCTLVEVVAGVKDFNDILTSNDLLSALATTNTAFQSKIYTPSTPSGEW